MLIELSHEARMRRLIRVFAGRTGLIIGFVVRWLKSIFFRTFLYPFTEVGWGGDRTGKWWFIFQVYPVSF